MKPGGTTSTSATASGSVRWAAMVCAISIGLRPVARCSLSAIEQA
jgi:hypothetical protein